MVVPKGMNRERGTMAKRETRALRRKRLRQEAAAVRIPTTVDVTVVGGGAAGLVAAITAAEAGSTVVVLERDLECGRKILATGNGRCNFANVDLDPNRYNHPDFVAAACSEHWLDDVLSFFRASGLRWSLEQDRLYPTSHQAASVRNVLLARARRSGVILAPARRVTTIKPASTRAKANAVVDFEDIEGTTGSIACNAAVIASGGGIHECLRSLPLDLVPTTPVLCPLACEDSPLAALDGRRAHACARLTKAGAIIPSWSERGEMLFRSYGLSGIVTFDASRRAEAGDLIEVDLAPDIPQSELASLVDPHASGSFEHGCLDGVLDPTIAALLETLARRRWYVPLPERSEPATDSEALVNLTKALPFRIAGPTEVDRAQLTRGGLAVAQFDSKTLASVRLPWLSACGEALDVDADCGGFNLAWAWKSGMVAGHTAARARV